MRIHQIILGIFAVASFSALINCAGTPDAGSTDTLSNTNDDGGTVLNSPNGQPASGEGTVNYEDPNSPDPHLNPNNPIVNVVIPGAGPNGGDLEVPSECVVQNNANGSCSLRVTICHRPPGNPQNGQTMSVGLNAARAHLRNHDHDEICPCDHEEE